MTRLLIVDCDDLTNVRFQEMFSTAGFDTRGTWSGQEALKLLEAGEFDVLLVDEYLPDLYAGEFLERVTRLPIQTCVVVMHRLPLRELESRRCEALGIVTVDKADPIKVRVAVGACRAGARWKS